MKRAEIVRAVKPYIQKAMQEIYKKGVPTGRNSTTYSFESGGYLYPPKYLVSHAFYLARGTPLSPDDHHGGEQDSNKVLCELVVDNAVKGKIVSRPSNCPSLLRPASAAEERQARERIERDISRRQGGVKFRLSVLAAYGRRCAITGCDAEFTLEAAHIHTYKGEDDNNPRNGILLRADIHTLFDLGLICVRASTCTVVTSKKLRGTCYESLDGKLVTLPADARLWHDALDYHGRKIFHP